MWGVSDSLSSYVSIHYLKLYRNRSIWIQAMGLGYEGRMIERRLVFGSCNWFGSAHDWRETIWVWLRRRYSQAGR
jgi:hypothetical protein